MPYLRFKHHTIRFTLALSLILALSACANKGQFHSYPALAQDLKSSFYSTSSSDALAIIENHKESRNFLLYALERGRLYQLRGDIDSSKAAFDEAINHFSSQDLKATVDLSDTSAEGLSLITNENVIPYNGAGYERILLHHFQALNYLSKQDYEGTAVELRRARLEQEILSEKYEQQIASVIAEAEAQDIELDPILDQFSGLNVYAGEAKSAFLNAYTFYFSAAFWESIGDLNSALVDYKKALEINPSNGLLREAVDRTQRGGNTQPRVWIFFEQGFVPEKRPLIIDIPNFDGGFWSIAFPYYDEPVETRTALEVSVQNDTSVFSQEIADIGAMAAKDLHEQLPKLITKQILRALAKHQLQRNLGKNFGFGAQLIANVYNKLSEQADLRSWLTLPNSVSAIELEPKLGKQTLRFNASGQSTQIDLDIKPNSKTIIRVFDGGSKLSSNVFKFGNH